MIGQLIRSPVLSMALLLQEYVRIFEMKKLALQELSRAKKMQLYNNFSTKSFDDKVSAVAHRMTSS